MTSIRREGMVHRRAFLVALSGLVIVAGLVVHRFGVGIIGDIGGDALYAVMLYLLLCSALPRSSPLLLGGVAFATCAAIEFFQLTGLPRAWAEAFPPAALVFGSGFDARDLVIYAGAIIVAVIIDTAVAWLLTVHRPAPDTPQGALPKENAL